ncbi:MAG: hypothetical protein V4449_03995 [Patescibacteria group bacterium]
MGENKENAFARRMQRKRDADFEALFKIGGPYSPEGNTCNFGNCRQPAIYSFPRTWDEVQYRCQEHRSCY